jgi:hypothetical protein
MKVDEIMRMFTRIPMPPGQINLYKVLYQANVPLSLEQIADQMREGDTQSLNTLLLALSKRIDDGAGQKRDENLSEIFEFSAVAFGKKLNMRQELRDAINRCPQLLEIIKSLSVQEIYEQYGRFPADESKYLDLKC